MSQRAAIITGATGGIGSALCREFQAAGYRVIATDRSGPAPNSAAAFVDADLNRLSTDAAFRASVLNELRSALAGCPVGVLVNNAALQVLGGVDDLSAEDWQTSLNVNVVAPFLLVQGLITELRSAGGCVINVSSIHEHLTKSGFVAYATSKAALSGMTRAMAVDLGRQVRVNAIAPAAIATPMLEAGFVGRPDRRAKLDEAHPLGRIGRPEEVARAALFLASEAASFISGTVLGVDGAIGARLHDPE